MSKVQSELVKQYVKAFDFVKTGKCSSEDYNSCDQPFFNMNITENGALGFNTTEVNKLLDEIPIKGLLEKIYRIIGNPKVEYYFKDWILQSLNNVKERNTLYLNIGQTRVVDFAHMHLGMGHIIVASLDPQDKKIFFRRDGGSNGWEREAAWEFISKYTPSDEKKYNLDKWFELIDTTFNISSSSFWQDVDKLCVN